VYEYKAKIISVYDGDTVRADIDLGFGIWHKDQVIRLAGINAPEMRGEAKEKEAGKLARDKLREKILDKEVKLVTFKDKKGKYGRWLAEIYYPYQKHSMQFSENLSVNQWLVNNNWAVEAKY